MVNADRINEIVRDKSRDLVTRLKASIRSYNMKHVPSEDNQEPLDKISARVSMKYGMATRIRIKFKRSGVFRHKGVGKGTKVNQVGTTTRRPAEWFNPVIVEVTEELAELVADEMAELALNNITIQ